MDVRSDPRVHERFLRYRERHGYFGRDDLRTPLSMEEFGPLDAEREQLDRRRKQLEGKDVERLAELDRVLFLD